MKPIRVLHILHSMNRGGAENSIMNYYRHIDRSKVQFDFLLTEQKECQFEKEIISLGGRVFRVPILTISNPFRYLFSVRCFFKTHPEYQIVHSHTSSKSFFPLALAKISSIPVRICHSHGSKSEKGWKGIVRNCLKKPLKLVATHFIACGKDAAIWLYGPKIFETGRVFIFPNVIEIDRFVLDAEKREMMRLIIAATESTVVIGCTARFSAVKNHDFLLSLFRYFHHYVPNSILLLVGDGELRSYLESKTEDYGIKEHVHFTGVVGNVNDYLQAMDFFMMPSINEGLPLSLIEAQISGLRCFVSEGVPRESDLTGLVTFLPLEKGPEYWAEMVIDSIGYKRESYIQGLVDAGYDAVTATHKLECFYIEVSLDNEII